MAKHDGEQRDDANPRARTETVGETQDKRDTDQSDTGRYSARAERLLNNAVSTTSRVGTGMVGGVTGVATDVVHGIGTVGGEVVNVVRDTANTAIVGVGSVGETAVHTVTGLLADLVGGLRDVGAAAVRGREGRTGGPPRDEARM